MKYGAVQWQGVQGKKARRKTKRCARKQERRYSSKMVHEEER
jgi:hypothetical protein